MPDPKPVIVSGHIPIDFHKIWNSSYEIFSTKAACVDVEGRKFWGPWWLFFPCILSVCLLFWSQGTAAFATPAMQKHFPIAPCLIDSPSVLIWTSFWWPMFTSGVNMLLFKVFLLCQLPFQRMIYYKRSSVLCDVEKGRKSRHGLKEFSLDWDLGNMRLYTAKRHHSDNLSSQITWQARRKGIRQAEEAAAVHISLKLGRTWAKPHRHQSQIC